MFPHISLESCRFLGIFQFNKTSFRHNLWYFGRLYLLVKSMAFVDGKSGSKW